MQTKNTCNALSVTQTLGNLVTQRTSVDPESSTSYHLRLKLHFTVERGWRSGESTRLPPMWPWFDSRSRCHMWVEFVVGSRPCSEGFSPVFLPPQKPTFPTSITHQWTKSHLFRKLLIYQFIYFIYFKKDRA